MEDDRDLRPLGRVLYSSTARRFKVVLRLHLLQNGKRGLVPRHKHFFSGKSQLASFTGSQLFTRDLECPADAEAERLREEEKNITGGNLILTISSNTAHHEEPTCMQLLRLCNFSVSKSLRGSSLSSTHGRMVKLFSNAVDVSCDVLLLDWWVAYFG